MDAMDPQGAEFWQRVGVAVLCGGIIGLERQLRNKPAGIRTSILICLGTQVFVQLGGLFQGAQADPTRVLGQVVTGIGFLGGGVILAREGLVVGVTSAAVIWVLAAVGATIGVRRSLAAIALTVLTVAVLLGVELLEATFLRLRGGIYSKDGGPLESEP